MFNRTRPSPKSMSSAFVNGAIGIAAGSPPVQKGDTTEKSEIEKANKASHSSWWSQWTPISAILTTAAVLFLSVVAVRIATAQISISFQSFHLNDLLTLLLALFSIWLSVLFFHQANNSNTQFYDNTYKFTQDVSIILGRIEAGFGERLRHLDEGYTGLRTSVDSMHGQIKTVKAKAVEEQGVVAFNSQERDELFQRVMENTSFAENERSELLEELRRKDAELIEARSRLGATLGELDDLREGGAFDVHIPGFEDYLRRKLDGSVGLKVIATSDDATIQELFASIWPSLVERAKHDLRRIGAVDSVSHKLTDDGIASVRRLVEQAMEH